MSSSKENQWLEQYGSLPRFISLKDNVTIKLDWFHDSHISSIFKLIEKMLADGTAGFSKDEFSSEDRLLWFINQSQAAVTAMESHSGNPIGFMCVIPSPLTRSVSPVMCAGYIIIDSKYQNLHLGMEMMLTQTALSVHYGYVGYVGRGMLLNAAMVVMSTKKGGKITGWIPKSMKTEQHGLTDDVVIAADTSVFCPLSSLSSDDILKRITETVGMRSNKQFLRPFKISSFQDKIQTSGHNTVLRTANKTEQHIIFQILDKAVKAGDTFALDEFPTFDIFTDKFLHARSLFILEEDSDVLGVGVIGPSYLCRGHDPNLALIYLYILPSHQGKGLGKAVLSSLEFLAKSDGFTGILTDIFITPTSPYGFMKAQGYIWVGTVINSGFIHGQGISDCAMFFKDFQTPFQIQSKI